MWKIKKIIKTINTVHTRTSSFSLNSFSRVVNLTSKECLSGLGAFFVEGFLASVFDFEGAVAVATGAVAVAVVMLNGIL